MEGLCSRRQAAHHDAAGNGVLAPFLPARVTEGVRQNPVFWFPREPIPRALSPALPATAGERSPAALRFLGDRRHMALPPLRHCDVCRSYSPPRNSRGALLRYLLMLRTTAGHRRACRTPAVRVPALHTITFWQPSVHRLRATSSQSRKPSAIPPRHSSFVRSLTSARGSSKAAFISHSQRPPQTPAASF